MNASNRSLRNVFAPVLTLVAAALAACGTPTGSERGACFPNGTCNAGLVCASNICVVDTAGDGSTSDASRTDVPTSDTAASDVPSTGDVVAMDTSTSDVPASDAPVSDTPVTGDTGGTCSAGVECTNYAAVLAAAPRGATSLDNCVVQLHQTDCCGARHAYGANHAARDTLCPAETACVATYPTPAGCSDSTITTDTGETTTNMADVKLRIVNGMPCSFDPTQTCYTCETFVCNTGSCRTAPGISGGCG